MTVYSIQLYGDASQRDYCGCYYVPCPDGDPRVVDLEAANCGRFLDGDGTVCRAFFFEDEAEGLAAQAAEALDCFAVVQGPGRFER